MRYLTSLVIVLFFSLGIELNAQDYKVMWKRVDEFQKKDMPRTVIKQAMDIFEVAKKNKNSGEMMKSYLVATQYRSMISRDSLKVDIKNIEKWASESANIQERSVLYAILGGLTITDNYEKGFVYLKKSLKNEDLLIKSNVRPFLPIINKGIFSSKYFNDNLYNLLARHAVSLLKNSVYRTKELQTETLSDSIKSIQSLVNSSFIPKSDYDSKVLILLTYQKLLRAYSKEENQNAWLLTRLDLLDYLHEKYRSNFSNIIYESTLKEWIIKYKHLDSCGSLFVKLSNYYRYEDKNIEALDVIDRGLERSPKYDVANELVNMRKEITNPYLSVDFPNIIPGKKDSIKVRYNNLNNLSFTIYKTNLSVTSSVLKDDELMNLKKYKFGKYIEKKTYSLLLSGDYKARDTILPFFIKEPGIYYCIAETKGKSVVKKAKVFYATSLSIIKRPLPNSRLEVVIVNSITGHPVPYASFNVYEKKNDSYEIQKHFNVNNNGKLIIDNIDNLYCNASYPNDNSMPITQLWRSFYGKESKNIEKQNVELFTDRSIYKPGQRVYLGGFVYAQFKDSTNVVGNKELEISMYDANNRVVDQNKVKTDTFGAFGGEFVIPKKILTGRFYLKAGNKTTTFRVEEYKRPTFSVKLLPYKEPYNINDSIFIKGVAQSFSGVPVQNAKVRYDISCNNILRFNISTNNWEGETETNNKGEFRIPVKLSIGNNKILDNHYWYYNFVVNADVVNMSGETQQGAMYIPLRSSSLKLNIENLGNIVYKESSDSVCFVVENPNGQKVNTPVKYVLSEYDSSNNSFKVLSENTINSNRCITISNLISSNDGRYKIEARVFDDKNRIGSQIKEFVIFSKNTARLPVNKDEWSYQTSTEFSTEKACDIFIGSSLKDVYMFYDLFSGNKRLESKTIQFTDSIVKFSYSYKKEYGDGVLASFAFVKNGKLFEEKFIIKKPKPQKKLLLKWSSFRDKLTPGDKQEWRLKVTDIEGNAVNASILATMFDASLENIYKNNWNFKINYNRFIPFSSWKIADIINTYFQFYFPFDNLPVIRNKYNRFNIPVSAFYYPMLVRGNSAIYMECNPKIAKGNVSMSAPIVGQDLSASSVNATKNYYRSDFAETAFFYPYLKTDSLGKTTFSFILPESLTSWKCLALAHTKDMDYGRIETIVTANKKFMIQPSLPRFVRVGDNIEIPSVVMNLSNKHISGSAKMELYNPINDKVYISQQKLFKVSPNENSVVRFTANILEHYSALACRIIAKGDEYSDGEQQILPVLCDKELVTKSIPFEIDKKGAYNFDIDTLFNLSKSNIDNGRITLEYTTNPLWYAIQSLPVLGMTKNGNAYSYALAFYANSLSKYIVNSNPKVKSILELSSGEDKDNFLSKLESNSDLKNIILNETPWIAEAENEQSQKERLTTLFDLNTFDARNEMVLEKLKGLQNNDGSWSWYKGMNGSRFVTSNVVELLVRLKKISSYSFTGNNLKMLNSAFDYLRKLVKEEYISVKKNDKQYEKDGYLSEELLQFLYLVSIDKELKGDKNIDDYFIRLLIKSPNRLNIYQKTLAAIILYNAGKVNEAKEFLSSILQYSVFTPLKGRFFDTQMAPMSSNMYRIPTEVAAIEAIRTISKDKKYLNEMKQWLISQKRVQQWSSPIETANAVYALLLDNNNILSKEDSINVKVNGGPVFISSQNSLGYYKKNIDNNKGQIKDIKIIQSVNNLVWGAIYNQYLHGISEISSFGKEIKISKALYRNGKRLNVNDKINVGDKINVKLFISNEIDVDFVNIKDGIAACMQPFSTLSGFKSGKNISYYEAIDNASVFFFIDKLPKGKYEIDYVVNINRAGQYETGITTVQSAYAPEFNGACKSIKLIVE